MTYIEFADAVEKMMNKKMKGGVRASLYTAMKNNGKERTGILIEMPGINISPTIYLEEYYESYVAGRKIEQIVDDIKQLYEEIKQEKPWDCESFRDYEGVRNRIVFKVINTAKNRKFLRTVPHLAFLDLSIVFYVLVDVSEEGTAAMVVNSSHADSWKVQAETLWEDAVKNVKNLLPAEFVTMNHALKSLLGDVEYEEGDLLLEKKKDYDQMYVLSNKFRNYGAACIAYPNVLEMIGQILKKDYYILPSSVHEVIIVYDTYIVSEKKAPEGLTPVGDFEITIEEDAKTLYYILENKKIFSPVKLVKKDSETEKIIPVAGAVFRLLDKDKKPITMTTHYPNESVYDLFKTDENGSFVLPEKLPAGNYYFQEVEAPQGYLIEDGLIPFTIIENHDWEKPFIVESKDRPAKGRIYIQKNDSVTGKGISGVKFEIKAAEDICTPDGTVRVEKGTVVGSLVTDQSGKAWSEELYLGTYEITETKQAEGYILPEKSVEIELEYEGQDVPVVTKETEILNKPTSVVIRKSDGETKKALSGVKFELREKISEINEESDAEEEDPSEENTTYITDENGEIHLSYLRPGVYCLYESEPLTGYIKNEEVWEFQIREDGTVEGEQEKILEIENHHTRITDTHAVWKESKAKEIIAGEEHIICDTVNFKYMEANASYTMKGILMDADTGKELLQDGKPVTSEKTFKGKDAKDGITMEFDVDSRKFPGKRIVVFEVLYLGDCLIDAHRDLRNQEQTVSILKKEEVTVKTGDNKVYMKQTILIMSASVCILYATWKRKKRRH